MPIRRPWTWLTLAGAGGFFLLRGRWPQVKAHVPPCELHRLTGLHCPGCGGTRCADRLLAGDLPGALAMNPLVILLALGGALLLATAVLREWQARPALPRIPGWGAWSLVSAVLLFGVLRNLPWWPFNLLAPG